MAEWGGFHPSEHADDLSGWVPVGCRCDLSEYANKENDDVLLLADLLGGLLAVVMLLSGMAAWRSKYENVDVEDVGDGVCGLVDQIPPPKRGDVSE